jgi:hypothetical protein
LSRRERRALRRIAQRLSAEDPTLAGLLHAPPRVGRAAVWTGTVLFAAAVFLDEGLLMLASMLVLAVPCGRWFVAWAEQEGRGPRR